VKKKKKALKAIVEIQHDGFTAYLDVENHGVYSAGKNLYDLRQNLEEALEGYLETAKEFKVDISDIKNRKIELQLDVKQFFEYFKSINLSGFAQYTGINRSLLNQYSKGLKRPSEKQSLRILEGIHNLGKDLISINHIQTS